jgi:hypothetical protein
VVADGFLFRPHFSTTQGKFRAGTAFCVRLDGQDEPVLLTALHLLGPSGGLPAEVAPLDVPRVVRGVELEDCFDAGKRVPVGNAALVIAEAARLGKPGKAGDVLAFRVPRTASVHAARLAAQGPAQGEKVWLAASVVGGAPPAQRLHEAQATGTTPEGELVYQFATPGLQLRATSGAPVLNAAGEVVAINLGGYEEGGKVHGIGNPVTQFRPFLEAAARNAGR